jgi:hypothetical protein
MKRGPLSLVSTIEELPVRKSNDFGLENREKGRRDPSRWPRGILYPQKSALTSPTSSGRSVGIVRSRTQATEFNLVFRFSYLIQCFTKVTELRVWEAERWRNKCVSPPHPHQNFAVLSTERKRECTVLPTLEHQSLMHGTRFQAVPPPPFFFLPTSLKPRTAWNLSLIATFNLWGTASVV